MPMEPENDEGPGTMISLQLDIIKLKISLPPNKLKRLKAHVASWRGQKAGKKRDLLSLLGLLAHTGKP